MSTISCSFNTDAGRREHHKTPRGRADSLQTFSLPVPLRVTYLVQQHCSLLDIGQAGGQVWRAGTGREGRGGQADSIILALPRQKAIISQQGPSCRTAVNPVLGSNVPRGKGNLEFQVTEIFCSIDKEQWTFCHGGALSDISVSATSPCFVPSANLLRLFSVPLSKPLTQGDPWGVSLVTVAKLKEQVRILCLEGFDFCWSVYRDVRRVLLKVYRRMYFIGDRLISVRVSFEMSMILKYLLLSKAWNIIWF